MAAFVVAPLFLSGLVAGGAYVLSKTNYPGDTAAQTVMRRVNEQMQITQKGLDSESAAKKVQFEVEVLNSMLVNVPDVNKEQVRQSIDSLVKELDRQKKGFYARKLNNDLRAINDVLNGVTFTDEEISRIRSDLEACQRNINKASPEDRETANANVMVLLERLRDLENVHRDRSTIKDIVKVLGLTTTPQDIVAKKGMLYDIIGRLERSNYATRQDKVDANDALKRLDALSLSEASSKDTSDLGKLKMLAKKDVWDSADVAEAQKLKQSVGNSQDARNAVREADDQHNRMKVLLDIPSHTSDIPRDDFEQAVRKLDELATALKLKLGSGTAPSDYLVQQAAKLKAYAAKLDVKRCKPPCSRDVEIKLDAVNNTLRDKFNVTAPSAARTSADRSTDFDYQIRHWRDRMLMHGMFKKTRDLITAEMKNETDRKKIDRMQALLDQTKKSDKEKLEILRKKFDGRKKPNATSNAKANISNDDLKRELEAIGPFRNNQKDENLRKDLLNNL